MLTLEEFMALLERYAADQCTQEERQRLEQWMMQPESNRFDLLELELSQLKEIIWQRIVAVI